MGRHVHQPFSDVEPRLAKPSAPLTCTFVEMTRLDEWLSHTPGAPLAVISFGTSLPSSSRLLNCSTLSINLPQLHDPARVEVWTSDQPIRMVRQGQLSIAMTGDIAMICMATEEATGLPLEATTCQTYRRLLSTVKEHGYPYLWRVWNYFSAINDQEEGLERYQRFCMGRHQALKEEQANFPASLPAATAVGTRSGPLQIYAIAGTHPAQHLGNPRQVHAYEYPSTYGPRSPSFSRATIAEIGGPTQLFLAGTASVIGHDSQHIGSAHAQTEETLHNIGAVLRHAQETRTVSSSLDPSRGTYKIYIRNQEDEEKVRQVIKNSPLSLTQALFFRGDLCRGELLVEIEGVLS